MELAPFWNGSQRQERASSRNLHLSAAHRAIAAEFPRLFGGAATPGEIRAGLLERGFEVDYIEGYHRRLGGVRLIDNFPVGGGKGG